MGTIQEEKTKRQQGKKLGTASKTGWIGKEVAQLNCERHLG